MSSSIARLTRLRWPPLMPFFSAEPISTSVDGVEAELFEHGVDATLDVAVAIIGRQAQAGRVVERLHAPSGRRA